MKPGQPASAAESDSLAWRDRLLAWFQRNARDLPWRQTRDPYHIWLSEVLLQQTRVETVLPYYRDFLEAFPDLGTLARGPEDRVLKAWEGLGYYRRALNLRRAAGIVIRERGGEYPRSASEWRELPGIGAYTSGALASIVNGERVPAVDGNVRRVLARIYAIEGERGAPEPTRVIDALAATLVPETSPGRYNQALMELGARICTPRRARCHECPVKPDCRAFAMGKVGAIPAPRRAKKTPIRMAAAAMIEHRGRYLLVKRPADGLLAGLWEFPGTRVRRGEDAGEALVRRIAEEWDVRIRVGRELARVRHDYSHFRLTLRLHECALRDNKTRPPNPGRGARWVTRRGLGRYALHGAMKKALAAIREE